MSIVCFIHIVITQGGENNQKLVCYKAIRKKKKQVQALKFVLQARDVRTRKAGDFHFLHR